MTATRRISIVTPSFNQAPYLEEAIDSVLSQKDVEVEYIIVDGGSTDGSVQIIEKYSRHLAYWVSEPDCGQAHAINKGMTRATAEVRAFLNSDDYYLPTALAAVIEHFNEHPETDLFHGCCRYVDQYGNKIGEQFASITQYDEIVDLWNVWWRQRQFVQPEVFWSRRIANRIGPFREDLRYVMDYEYWLRIIKAGGKVSSIARELTAFRHTPEQKSNDSELVAQELCRVVEPELWDSSTPLPSSKRRQLQARWLFQSVFQPAADAAVALGYSRLHRWGCLAALVLRHPKLVFSPCLRRRALHRTPRRA